MTDPENFDLDGWEPAFPGQRPPFAPGNKWRVGEGNEIARKHGAYSMREVLPLAAKIAKELRAQPGLEYLRAPLFADRLAAYTQAMARLELVTAWIAEMSPEDAVDSTDGHTPPIEMERQLANRVISLGDPLGLSPAGAALYADDIERAWKTIDRRIAHKQLQADLRDSLTKQVEDGGPR